MCMRIEAAPITLNTSLTNSSTNSINGLHKQQTNPFSTMLSNKSTHQRFTPMHQHKFSNHNTNVPWHWHIPSPRRRRPSSLPPPSLCSSYRLCPTQRRNRRRSRCWSPSPSATGWGRWRRYTCGAAATSAPTCSGGGCNGGRSTPTSTCSTMTGRRWSRWCQRSRQQRHRSASTSASSRWTSGMSASTWCWRRRRSTRGCAGPTPAGASGWRSRTECTWRSGMGLSWVAGGRPIAVSPTYITYVHGTMHEKNWGKKIFKKDLINLCSSKFSKLIKQVWVVDDEDVIM